MVSPLYYHQLHLKNRTQYKEKQYANVPKSDISTTMYFKVFKLKHLLSKSFNSWLIVMHLLQHKLKE